LYANDAAAGLREIDRAKELLGSDRSSSWLEVRTVEASLLDKAGRTAEALPVLRELATSDPTSSRYAFNLAYALDRAHEVAEARQWYEKALELDAGNRSAALCLVWLHATAPAPTGDVDTGERLLVKTLRADRGRTQEVLTMVRDFCLRTKRLGLVLPALAELAADESLPADLRARLTHERSFVQNAVPDDK
ncbi:MAG TPA: tetratricopeptide repeat protein, partial [Planctomycetota bacterium]|nr:tetratricopeptide repeat protein [Planctomycetota bacterium]